MVQISAPVNPDDLIAIASSYDSTGRFGAQTPFSDQLDNRWMGGLWQVDSTHNSIIAVTNAGKATTTAVLTFHYNGGKETYHGGVQEGQTPTTGDGSFPDTYYVCSSSCPGSGYTDALQTWIIAGIPLAHVDGLTYACTSITIDGY